MKIFIINLKRSLERKALMLQHLEILKNHPLYKELNIEYHFFEATDSHSQEFLTYKKQFNPFTCFMLHKRILSNSEIACYASHYRLWQECLRLQEPIIVLEDDVSFEVFFLEALQTIKASNLAFVRLYYLTHRWDKNLYKFATLAHQPPTTYANITDIHALPPPPTK